ncbi:hypothetical protein AAG570_007169 [Ranatra chinensis]|uniref:C2H2-type domain-containing protein n=1 Tax=Ranatra chinensis TaxID=642074 RepID=A0ABD0YAC1_9HEMI
MASKRRNMFYEKKKQETTEIELWGSARKSNIDRTRSSMSSGTPQNTLFTPTSIYPHRMVVSVCDYHDEGPGVDSLRGHLTATDSTEYTDHLLSQLSAGVLPTMSSSQVSSVLSALEPNVSLQNGVLNDTAPAVKADVGLKSALRTTQPAVRREAPVPAAPSQPAAPDRLQPPPAPPPQSQPTIFVKIESSGTNISEAIVRRQQHSTKKKAKIKYTPVECKAGQLRWYKCSGCAFACLGRDSAVGHCARVHGAGVPSSPALARNFRQPKLRCIACPNTFYSLQSVKEGGIVSICNYHAKGPEFDSPRDQSWLKARLASGPLGV